MKKSLIALAVLTASGVSFAQSSVTISGTFDPSVANAKTTYGNGNSVTQNTIRNNSQGTSQVTIVGTEDLGGGLKANFLFENDFDASKESTGNFASKGGEQYVGLSGGFGAIQIGAANTPSLDVSGRTPFGTKIGSGFANGGGTGTGKGTASYGVQGLGHVRENNSVVYTAPTMSGFTPKVGYQFNTDAIAEANVNAAATKRAAARTDLGLSYVNGPLTAVIAQYQQKDVYKQTHGYVAYQIGALKATYGFNRDNRLATVTGKAYDATAVIDTTNNIVAYTGQAGYTTLTAGKLAGQNIAADYALASNINLLANYGKLNDKTTDNFDRKISAVGVKYELSPRTSLNARLVKLTVDNTNSQAIQAKEQKTTLFGLVHSF